MRATIKEQSNLDPSKKEKAGLLILNLSQNLDKIQNQSTSLSNKYENPYN